MPNYDGKSPLIMKCPYCNVEGKHSVVKTEPGVFRWSNDATKAFNELFNEDISFRKRIKRCISCSGCFETVEFSRHFLKKIIEKLVYLQKVDSICSQKEDEIKALKVKLEKIVEVAQC